MQKSILEQSAMLRLQETFHLDETTIRGIVDALPEDERAALIYECGRLPGQRSLGEIRPYGAEALAYARAIGKFAAPSFAQFQTQEKELAA